MSDDDCPPLEDMSEKLELKRKTKQPQNEQYEEIRLGKPKQQVSDVQETRLG